MEEQLKRLKQALHKQVFKDFDFTDQHRQAVKRSIRMREEAKETGSFLNQWSDETFAHVLQSIAEQPKCGFEITTVLYQIGDWSFQNKEGNIYTLLHYLEQKGIVHSQWKQSDDSNQKTRKYYELTKKGRKLLQSAVEEQSSVKLAPSLKQIIEGGGL